MWWRIGLLLALVGLFFALACSESTPRNECRGIWQDMLRAGTDEGAQALYFAWTDACDGATLKYTCEELRHQRDLEAKTNMAQITVDLAADDIKCLPWPLVNCAAMWSGKVLTAVSPQDRLEAEIVYRALGCTMP